MILLDTNVVSEPWRPTPAPPVISWLDRQAVETLFLSTISVAELRAGVALLPEGKRRSAVQDRVENGLLPAFAGRTLPFDLASAATYAQVVSTARAAGRPIHMADACIAAIALANGLSVASRDVRPFQAVGLTVINPWEG